MYAFRHGRVRLPLYGIVPIIGDLFRRALKVGQSERVYFLKLDASLERQCGMKFVALSNKSTIPRMNARDRLIVSYKFENLRRFI
jgi:hypothetical protein